MYQLLGAGFQAVVVVVAVVGAVRSMRDSYAEIRERLARLEAKVDVLYSMLDGK